MGESKMSLKNYFTNIEGKIDLNLSLLTLGDVCVCVWCVCGVCVCIQIIFMCYIIFMFLLFLLYSLKYEF